ncbi:MAG: biotin/lipoyl-binding carrier protein [Aeromicrobium sp.]
MTEGNEAGARVALPAPVVANVWQLHVKPGDRVEVGTVVAVLESMKMEIPVESHVAGTVVELPVPEGTIVQEGDPVAFVETSA